MVLVMIMNCYGKTGFVQSRGRIFCSVVAGFPVGISSYHIAALLMKVVRSSCSLIAVRVNLLWTGLNIFIHKHVNEYKHISYIEANQT